MYKKASKLKLRFQTTRGLLTAEQLWDLPLTTLDALAVSLEREYKESGKKSFLDAKSKKDKEIKLKFDIVLDILNSKVEDNDAAKNEMENKVHNQKILAFIKEKQDGDLKELPVKELEKLLR